MASFPEELLEKVLVEAAVMKASRGPICNNNERVYRGLAGVWRQWKRVVEDEEFREMFLYRVNRDCKLLKVINAPKHCVAFH